MAACIDAILAVLLAIRLSLWLFVSVSLSAVCLSLGPRCGCITSCFMTVYLTAAWLLFCKQSYFLPLLFNCRSCFYEVGSLSAYLSFWHKCWCMYDRYVSDFHMAVRAFPLPPCGCLSESFTSPSLIAEWLSVWLLFWCLPWCYLAVSLAAGGQLCWVLAGCIPVCFVAVSFTTVRLCPTLRVVLSLRLPCVWWTDNSLAVCQTASLTAV